jgi:hypothetical protein
MNVLLMGVTLTHKEQRMSSYDDVKLKHYYGDNGILDYAINRELLVAMAELLPHVDGAEKAIQRGVIQEMAVVLEYDYICHQGCGGMGGCLTLAQWKLLDEETPLKTTLKKLLFDFAEQGYVVQEFLLVAHAAACEIQIHNILEGVSK